MVAGAVAPPRIDLRNRDLIRSHVHAIWMEACEAGPGSNAECGAGSRPRAGRNTALAGEGGARGGAAQSDPSRHCARQGRCRHRGDPFGARRDRMVSTSAGWTRCSDRSSTASTRPASAGAACTAPPSTSAHSTTTSSATIPGQSPSATILEDCVRRRKARSASSPKRRVSTKETSTPTATSRRKASFPATTFPRLPISAYVPARRGRTGRDEFISRPRFLAISEFGPRALIYHEGARYRVYKVNLDFGAKAIEDTHRLATETMKRCPSCGYAHLEAMGPNLAELCERCGAALNASIANRRPGSVAEREPQARTAHHL